MTPEASKYSIAPRKDTVGAGGGAVINPGISVPQIETTGIVCDELMKYVFVSIKLGGIFAVVLKHFARSTVAAAIFIGPE
jgi:hypothetical protein